MNVGMYGRVSTSDKEQNVETQLLPLREFCAAQGWTVFGEFTDEVPATDLARRTQWRELLDHASKRRFDLVLVWRMDRAFRSVLDAATTLERLRGWSVGLRSYSEPWLDTTSPFGEALYYITVAYAQLERGILRERVKAGMERARKQGKRIGRPRVTDRKGFRPRLQNVLERISAGSLSRRQAAKELRIGYATLKRILDGQGKADADHPEDRGGDGGDAHGDARHDAGPDLPHQQYGEGPA
jgi:putative DNA-invertase from lambdoid prophage Rac